METWPTLSVAIVCAISGDILPRAAVLRVGVGRELAGELGEILALLETGEDLLAAGGDRRDLLVSGVGWLEQDHAHRTLRLLAVEGLVLAVFAGHVRRRGGDVLLDHLLAHGGDDHVVPDHVAPFGEGRLDLREHRVELVHVVVELLLHDFADASVNGPFGERHLFLGRLLEDEAALDEMLHRVAVDGLEVRLRCGKLAVAPHVAEGGAHVVHGDDRVVDFGGQAVKDHAVRACAGKEGEKK